MRRFLIFAAILLGRMASAQDSGDMMPRLANAYISDSGFAPVVRVADGLKRHPLLAHTANDGNIFFPQRLFAGKKGASRWTMGVPLLSDHVLRVLLWRACGKMFGVNAGWGVAGMQYVLPWRDGAIENREGYAGCSSFDLLIRNQIHQPVSVLVSREGPRPTVIRVPLLGAHNGEKFFYV